MTRFGDWPLNAEMGPQDVYRQGVPNIGVAAETWTLFQCGAAYVMPFAGELYADFKVRVYWNTSDAWYRANLGGSFPQPPWYTTYGQRSGFPGAFNMIRECAVLARWQGLAAGTNVTCMMNVYSGYTGMVIVAGGGILRARPT